MQTQRSAVAVPFNQDDPDELDVLGNTWIHFLAKSMMEREAPLS